MQRCYLVKETGGRLFYDSAQLLSNPSSLHVLDHELKLKILKQLAKRQMYAAELARNLKVHEQKVYYHIRQLVDAGIIEVVERRPIRGTTAKMYSAKAASFAYSLGFDGKPLAEIADRTQDTKLVSFLHPFIEKGRLNSHIVVGSPDPHGPFKARARDGHYAIDLALFLGQMCSLPRSITTLLDVEVNLKTHEHNLILVGGPVTNLTMARVNDNLSMQFSEKKPWGIAGKNMHSEESNGLIAKLTNPFNPSYSILVLAGIRYSGTMAAVLGLTRYSSDTLSDYRGSGDFSCIVEGFDLDGDGRVDSVEVKESYNSA